MSSRIYDTVVQFNQTAGATLTSNYSSDTDIIFNSACMKTMVLYINGVGTAGITYTVLGSVDKSNYDVTIAGETAIGATASAIVTPSSIFTDIKVRAKGNTGAAIQVKYIASSN
jgi:hypothetical protein